jgi:hypothetical protein
VTVRFTVRVTHPPPASCGPHRSIELGIQKKDEVLPARLLSDGTAEVDGELRLKENSATPVFLGPFAFGPPSTRFVYLSWSGEIAGKREMFRRMKLPLGGISGQQLAELARRPDGRLVVTVQGTARDGGPACATVPLLDGGWKVEGA